MDKVTAPYRWEMSPHKSQGGTFPVLVVVYGTKEQAEGILNLLNEWVADPQHNCWTIKPLQEMPQTTSPLDDPSACK